MFSGFFYLDYLSCILSVKEKREILGCGFDRVGKLIEVFFWREWWMRLALIGSCLRFVKVRLSCFLFGT